MKIGVFDSGVGGKSVANAIERALPSHTVAYAQDKKNVPYGTKTPAHLLELVPPILQKLIDEGCEVIVIACNTVTTTIITELRERFAIPLIGTEPMIEAAAQQSKSRTVAVCATPATLNSHRYRELVSDYGADLTILEPDCSDWSSMIEQNITDYQHIMNQIKEVCEQGADLIVLGCTHYHWIESEIETVAKQYGAQVLQPETVIIGQVKQEILQLG